MAAKERPLIGANQLNLYNIELAELADTILETKGVDYASIHDRLLNFYEGAIRLGNTPFQELGTHLNKQYDAILRFIRTGNLESEPLENRIADAFNYLRLLYAMARSEGIIERNEEDD